MSFFLKFLKPKLEQMRCNSASRIVPCMGHVIWNSTITPRSHGRSTSNKQTTRNMRTLFITVAILAASISARSQTKTVCDASPAPSGWVTISYGGPCDSIGTRSRTLQEIDNMPAGSSVNICGTDAPPMGWVTTAWGDSCARLGGRVFYGRTVKNTNGMPAGTTITVCGADPQPFGWVVDGIGGTCATVGGTAYPSRTIRKL